MYNMATRKVEEVAKPPRVVQFCAGVACGGLVYSLGGWDKALLTAVADVCTYNPDIDSWVDGPALPLAKWGMAAAEHMGCIYACGGYLVNDPPLSGSLLMMDPRTRAWATLPTMPTLVTRTCAAVVAGRMYIPGGRARRTWTLPTLQCYDLVAGRWDTGCAPLAQAQARIDHGVAAMHGEVWVVGGEDDDHDALASVVVYSPRLNTWRLGVSLPQAWSSGACAVVQCKLLGT